MSVSLCGSRRLWMSVLSGLVVVGCSPRTHNGGRANGSEGSRRVSPSDSGAASDPSAFYRQLGMIAQGGTFPFVGQVRYLGGSSADSTLALITLSFANRVLTFGSDGSGQRAAYNVTIDLTQGTTTLHHLDVHKVIRVASFHETQREDESVIFQQFFQAAPGTYSLSIAVRDEGSGNANSQQMTLTVPHLGPHTLSTPISVYEVTPRTRSDTVPALIANPRSIIVLGRDTLAGLYLEGYGLPDSARVTVAVVNDAHAVILRDTVNLVRQGSLSSALLDFPVASIGVGPVTVLASLVGSTDSVRAPLFLSFGDAFGITSFDQLLSYLRFFTSPERLQALRDTPPDQRAAAWTVFWKQTDPNSATQEHEALRDYFKRIATANSRFVEKGTPGWLTDRGRVYVTLGEPDQAGQQMGGSVRNRAEIWAYTRYNLRLTFTNQGAIGRYRLTASSESDFEKVVKREQSR